MSHFPLHVLTDDEPDENLLDAILAPYNENVEVAPYLDQTRTTTPDGDVIDNFTTYNPDSKWDWWTVGGRWAGSLPGAQGKDIVEVASLADVSEEVSRKEARFRGIYREFLAATEGLERPTLMPHEMADKQGITVEQARENYSALPPSSCR